MRWVIALMALAGMLAGCSTGHDADCLDASVAEGEHDVAGRHLSHVLVELIADSVRVSLRRPHEAPADFGPIRLVLIDPPVPHSVRPARRAYYDRG